MDELRRETADCPFQAGRVDASQSAIDGMRRDPPIRYSGAPHSSSMTCDSRWQKEMPPGLLAETSDSELAAVPVPTKKTATSRSNILEKVSPTFRSRSPLP